MSTYFIDLNGGLIETALFYTLSRYFWQILVNYKHRNYQFLTILTENDRNFLLFVQEKQLSNIHANVLFKIENIVSKPPC